MHPVRVVTYDMTAEEPQRLEKGIDRGKVAYMVATSECLSYELEFSVDESPTLEGFEAHVLPTLGVRVARFHRRAPVSDDFGYYVDIVRVTEQNEQWVVRDLYLDVLVFDGIRAKILDTDEYLEARAEGHMDADEADYALLKLHEFLDGLGRHGYALSGYLASQGVTLTWRR